MTEPAAPSSLVAHADFVRHLARHLVGTEADADDVAQETYARALARPPRDLDRPRPWLAGVVRNVVRRLRRDAVRRGRRERAASRPEGVVGPGDIAARTETLRAVEEAVRSLDEPHRAVVLLRHYDGLPPREIAARLGVPVETVHTRLRRAHARLRDRLDGEAGEIGRSWRATMLAFLLADASRHAAPAAGAGAAPLVAGAAVGKGVAVAAVVVVLGAVFALLPRREAPSADDSRADAPALASAGAEEASKPPALAAGPRRPERNDPPAGAASGDATKSERLSGTCVDEQGQALSGATVYVVPKGTPGSDELRFPHGVSDESGRFEISKAPARGAWVCAVKDGYLPASLDGDTTGDGSALRLVLPTGREVVVNVSSSGPRGLPAHVWVGGPVMQQGAVKFPAPGTPWMTSAREDVPEGQATLRIGTRDSVRVTASPNTTAWLSDPEEIVLSPSEREAAFRLLPSGVMKIRVLHQDGSPFDAPFQALRLLGGSEKVVNGMTTTNPDRTGAFDDWYGIRPGAYRLRVFADGYAVWTSALLTFANPGDAVEVRAPLVPDPARRPGTLVLSIPVAEAVGTPWYREPPPSGKGVPGAMVRTAGEKWFAPGGAGLGVLTPKAEMRTSDSTWNESARELRIRVPAGVYDVLVWDRASWTCGFAAGLALPADGIATATVPLRVGVRVRIADLVAKGDSAKDLLIRANGVNDLLAGEESPGRGETYGGAYGAPFEAVLKPLPFDTLHVSWSDSTGPHEKDVKAEVEPQEGKKGASGAGPR